MRTTLLQLRVLLSEASREGYRQRMLRWFADSDHECVQWMIRNGYAPVPRGDEDEVELGCGTRALVYGAIAPDNRYVAVKFMFESELKSYEILRRLRDACPNIVKRHLLEVIYTVKIKLHHGTLDAAVVVVEPLVPMTMGDEQIWDSIYHQYYYNAKQQRIKMFFHDKSILDDIVQDVLKQSDITLTDTSRKSIVDALLQALQKCVDIDIIDRPIIIELFQKALHNIKYLFDIDIDFFIEQISHVLLRILTGDIFPIDFYLDRRIEMKTAGINRGMRSLLNALQYIAKHFNFNWRDVHGQNIMVRPSTGEYVVSDVGCFEDVS